MEAMAISHIAICTRDMEKSLTFYRDILGRDSAVLLYLHSAAGTLAHARQRPARPHPLLVPLDTRERGAQLLQAERVGRLVQKQNRRHRSGVMTIWDADPVRCHFQQ